MEIYPLHVTKDGLGMQPTHTLNSEEFIREHNDFYLKQELGYKYRLHAKDAHFTDDFLPYRVYCPSCRREMKCIGGPKTLHELGLYECRCTKR